MNEYTKRMSLRSGENLGVWHHSLSQPDEITVHVSIGKWTTHIDLNLEEQQELVKLMEEARKVAIDNASEIPNGSLKESKQ